MQEKKARIEVGYGLEGVLTDALASRIIREQLAPPFREGRFTDGIAQTVVAIEAATRGEYTGSGRSGSGSGRNSLPPLASLLIMFIIIAVLRGSILPLLFGAQMLGGGGARGRRGGGWSSGGWSGGGFGGFGGGGGGGGGGFWGGGGSSGGGGASGGW